MFENGRKTIETFFSDEIAQMANFWLSDICEEKMILLLHKIYKTF